MIISPNYKEICLQHLKTIMAVLATSKGFPWYPGIVQRIVGESIYITFPYQYNNDEFRYNVAEVQKFKSHGYQISSNQSGREV